MQLLYSLCALLSIVAADILDDLYREHNAQRIHHNVAPFACLDTQLNALTATHVAGQIVAHSLDHTKLAARCHAIGPDVVCGENSVRGKVASANGMVMHWMNSTKHRANILNPDFTRVGFSVQKANASDEWVATALFATGPANCSTRIKDDGTSIGRATTYGGVDGVDVNSGNCGLMDWIENAKTFHAAINQAQWASGTNCGRCVQVTCVDDRCPTKTPVLGQVSDQCHGCADGSLDLTLPFFQKVTGATTDSFAISWRFVDCPVSGGVKVCAKAGSNPHWLALQPANARHGVAKMSINGAASNLFSTSSNFFFMAKGHIDFGAAKVEMTSIAGETISATVSLTAGQCTELPHQFQAAPDNRA
ncbi:hypothetical protein SPRG_13882 [Saprolegnia parasitica CBS 223.65]|uniref:Expansin-like EG45 domain-containing protein n=1 Tax=Saprolegnia parasitica (strain CBS 223.65) TaxID=695850 RepID=A0A067BR39_SAPPC|nr:hypothetical protein SPRG_13882 [Saprolegnia parasitica CBS 223.65]KDO20989.1 hypothetical protein SPRG_13882 [Saprolegnia parasitica CBS 223.65]|eukprot:XP_012208301.1 hypothetical protein SPRG_13882 [Saprolegnia parasitica CBS 223.65]